jgi:sec-independent protein translocase protein TatB
MKETVEGAAKEVENSVQTSAIDFEKAVERQHRRIEQRPQHASVGAAARLFRTPRQKVSLKTSVRCPQWYKARAGVRTRTQSGAARVARHRPTKLG